MIELFGRLVRWFVRSIGGTTLLRLVLLSLTLVSVEGGLIAIVGNIHTDYLALTAMFGVLVGWLMGRTRLRGWASGVAGIGIGLVWLILSVGQMSAPIDVWLVTLPPILKQFIFRVPTVYGPLLDAWTALNQELVALSSRFSLWFNNAGSNTLITDPAYNQPRLGPGTLAGSHLVSLVDPAAGGIGGWAASCIDSADLQYLLHQLKKWSRLACADRRRLGVPAGIGQLHRKPAAAGRNTMRSD